MLSFMLYFLVTTLMFGNLCKGKHTNGSVQFRISETEFNKVASVLLQPRDAYQVTVTDSKVQGMYNGSSYEITDLHEKSSLHVVHVQVPADDKLVATTFSSVILQSGKLKLTRLNGTEVIFDGQFDVTLENVTIEYSGLSDMSSLTVPSNSVLPVDFSNCSAQIETLTIKDKIRQYSGVEVTNEDWKEIFQNTVCQVYKAKFSLGFGDSEVSFTIFDVSISVHTVVSDLDIKNKNIIITQKVNKSFKGKETPPYVAHPFPTVPPPDASSQPFEIVLQADVLNELFRDFKQALGIGVKKMTIEKLLPNLKAIAELDTEGQYMRMLFPPVVKKYPNAVGRIVLLDADIYFTIKNGSVQMHFDIASTLAVTLNCDKNRTYTAFNFSMNLDFPTQVGYDNKYLTMKVVNLGGNFTVLNSTVGHIMDRGLISLLYSASYFLSDQLDEFNGLIKGIPLKGLLPDGVFTVVKSVSVKENSVIVGGNLSPTDPHLSRMDRNQIKWAGYISKEDLFLQGRDNTPENPEGFQLKEENCTKPPAKVNKSFKGKETPPYVAHPFPTVPPPDASSQPFEIVLQADVLNELFRDFKQALGIGVKKMTIEKLLPNLKAIAELDTEGQYMRMLFPPVVKKYPNAVGRIVLLDADIYFTIKNGSVQMHFDIASTLAVTLNCDKNRTYTAFNFSMNLDFPTQVGYDNKYLTMKVVNLGGNFTVLNSTVGHIMDRGLISSLYSASYFLSDQLDEFNGLIKGIPLKGLLPDGVFTVVKSVSVKENSVIVGGNLSPTDPHLSRMDRNQIKWAGYISKEDLFLQGRDNTPENPEGFQLKEENCTKPPAKVSSACRVKLQTVFLCFQILILKIW